MGYLAQKPPLYEKSTAPFWDDPHISEEMLKAHLDPFEEGASRKHDFIEKSASWIRDRFWNSDKNRLLDLGCGPGLYAECFCKAGFRVTGVDFSRRSIEYALSCAEVKRLVIDYSYKNYLEIDDENRFDTVTLIYCDFGVLPPADRRLLLSKIRRALSPGGKLILDGFTKHETVNFREGCTARYYEQGFCAPYPYFCIQNNYTYEESANYLEQYVIVSENGCQCYNNWNQIYKAESLTNELTAAGFQNIELYDDVSGSIFTNSGKTICAVCENIK